MSDIICITNRKLCEDDFLTRIEMLAKVSPKAIILREKDLSEDEYFALAKDVIAVCEKYNTECILHSFFKAAIKLNYGKIHLPLHILKEMSKEERERFTVLGASCHSVEEAKEAENLGCTYITAGHIFATDCKKGLPGRGLDFLKNVVSAVNIPVYAIGGIDSENIGKIKENGAAGACVMSGCMQCENPEKYIKSFEVKNEIQS